MNRVVAAVFVVAIGACAEATPPPRSAPHTQAAASKAEARTDSGARDEKEQCEPITLVQNDDGSLEVREPREGEGIVGLVADGIEVSLAPAPKPVEISDPPAALSRYESPPFKALGRMTGADAEVLALYEQWLKARPLGPSSLSEFQGEWLVTMAEWMLEMPNDHPFSSAELTVAASGIASEHSFGFLATLMPEQIAKSDAANTWRAAVWTASRPFLNRAHETYEKCAQAQRADLAKLCRTRMGVLQHLIDNSGSPNR